jgi:hypothetical protein
VAIGNGGRLFQWLCWRNIAISLIDLTVPTRLGCAATEIQVCNLDFLALLAACPGACPGLPWVPRILAIFSASFAPVAVNAFGSGCVS